MELVQNMAYQVIVISPVKRRLDMHLNYAVEKNKTITEKTREKSICRKYDKWFA